MESSTYSFDKYSMSVLDYLSFINFSPSHYNNLYTALQESVQHAKDKCKITCIITCDQPLYIFKIRDLVAALPDLDDILILLRLG